MTVIVSMGSITSCII